MQKPNKNIEPIFIHPCHYTYNETVFGYDVTVNYLFQMYTGETKVNAKYRGYRRLVEVSGYRLVIVRTLTFGDADMKPDVLQKLREQGYRMMMSPAIGWVAVLNKDFGYLASRSVDISNLIWKRLTLEGFFNNWESAVKEIFRVAGNWGEEVIDVNGNPVYEEGRIKRDPFAKAGRQKLMEIIRDRKDRQDSSNEGAEQ